MNKSKEIEMILKLLEEKKITSEEAKMLIDALNDTKTESEQNDDYYESKDFRDSMDEDSSEKFDRFSEKFDGFDDFRKKYSNFGKDIKDVIFDKLSDIKSDVYDSLSFDIPNNADLNGFESKDMEFELDNKASLKLEGTNSSVSIKRASGDKTVLTISVKLRDYERINEIVEIQYSKDILELSIDDMYKEKVIISLQLPDMVFSNIKVATTNGPISIMDASCEHVILEGTNGSVSVRRCIGKVLKAETSNGSVRLEQNNFDESIVVESSNGSVQTNMDYSKLIDMETTNGSIKFNNSSARSFKAETTNGAILFDRLFPYQSEGKFLMMGETTNGSVTVYINRDFGAVFECSAGRHGNIRLGRNFNMQSMQRNSLGRISYAKGESRFAYKSDIVAAVETETSNGTITMEFV